MEASRVSSECALYSSATSARDIKHNVTNPKLNARPTRRAKQNADERIRIINSIFTRDDDVNVFDSTPDDLLDLLKRKRFTNKRRHCILKRCRARNLTELTCQNHRKLIDDPVIQERLKRNEPMADVMDGSCEIVSPIQLNYRHSEYSTAETSEIICLKYQYRQLKRQTEMLTEVLSAMKEYKESLMAPPEICDFSRISSIKPAKITAESETPSIDPHLEDLAFNRSGSTTSLLWKSPPCLSNDLVFMSPTGDYNAPNGATL